MKGPHLIVWLDAVPEVTTKKFGRGVWKALPINPHPRNGSKGQPLERAIISMYESNNI